MSPYSVLITVYYKETPENLTASIESMLNQTVRPSDIVLVCDGPLDGRLNKIIHRFTTEYGGLFQVMRLNENVGIGSANNAGIQHCRHELVAKIDSDDISHPDRCRRQLELFEQKPELSICGAQLEEFLGTPDNILAVRNVPLGYAEILKYARRRMPFNNPTVMYKKSEAIKAGGFSDLRRCEDYDMYVRMLQQGCIAENLPDVLTSYRLSEDAYRRRGSFSNLSGFISVRWRIYRSGFSGFFDFLVPTCGQILLTIAPNRLKDVMYRKIMR